MKKLFVLFAGLFILMPSLALASVMRSGDAMVGSTENIPENVYLAGSNPMMSGTIQGDLAASGANVFVNGNVSQDAMLAGGTVNVTGHIGGDLRVFSGNFMIDGPVDGELMVFGGNITVGPHAVIQGDVNIFGGKVLIDPMAKMMSKNINIQYSGKSDLNAPHPFVVDTNKFLTAGFWISQILIVIALFVVIAIMQLLFPNFNKKFVETSSRKTFWKCFLIGLVMLIVMPIAAILCFITGIGAILGGLILIAYVAFIIASVLYSGVAFGGLLYEQIKKPKKYAMGWGWLVLGVVGLHVISWIPVIGVIIGFVFFLSAWGAMALVRWKQMKST